MTPAPRGIVVLLLMATIALFMSACSTAAMQSAQIATPTPSVILPTVTPLLPTITTGSNWIPLRSTSTADIIAAARDTLPMTYQGGDSFPITASSPTGTPVLVLALRDSDFAQPPDFYVVPILTNSGAPVADVTLELNADHTSFRQGGISSGGSRPQGILWQHSASQAGSALEAQRHVALMAGFTPVLVYWPVNATHFETGEITWNGGSLGPTTPAWLLRGTNSQYYIMANDQADDGHIYALSEMPLHTLPPAGY